MFEVLNSAAVVDCVDGESIVEVFAASCRTMNCWFSTRHKTLSNGLESHEADSAVAGEKLLRPILILQVNQNVALWEVHAWNIHDMT